MSAATMRQAAAGIRAGEPAAAGGAVWPTEVAAVLAEAADCWDVLAAPGVLGNVANDPLLASAVAAARAYLGEGS